jgi:hypothetical protein
MVWFVSRQRYWPDGDLMVEIAGGGRDYSNPDMFSPKYPGEGKEYADPREAVKAALTIRDLWKKDAPDEEIGVDEGCTGGWTMPFDGSDDDTLIAWAEKEYADLEKCALCGKILPAKRERWQANDWSGEEYCSEDCARIVSEDEAEQDYKYRCAESAQEIVDILRADPKDIDDLIATYSEVADVNPDDLRDAVELLLEAPVVEIGK